MSSIARGSEEIAVVRRRFLQLMTRKWLFLLGENLPREFFNAIYDTNYENVHIPRNFR